MLGSGLAEKDSCAQLSFVYLFIFAFSGEVINELLSSLDLLVRERMKLHLKDKVSAEEMFKASMKKCWNYQKNQLVI